MFVSFATIVVEWMSGSRCARGPVKSMTASFLNTHRTGIISVAMSFSFSQPLWSLLCPYFPLLCAEYGCLELHRVFWSGSKQHIHNRRPQVACNVRGGLHYKLLHAARVTNISRFSEIVVPSVLFSFDWNLLHSAVASHKACFCAVSHPRS